MSWVTPISVSGRKSGCCLTQIFKTNPHFFLAVLFVLFFFGTRVPRLYDSEINPDGVNWHYRSRMFMNGLKYGDLTKTYQHYHPGVTLMWLTAPAIEMFRQFPGNDAYDISNFQGFDFVVKMTLITVQAILTVLILYLLSGFVGFFRSLAAVSLFTFEPFFTGNSRLYHLDVLVSLLLVIFVLFYLKYRTTGQVRCLVTAGLFLALSFLTKTVSGIFLIVVIILEAIRTVHKPRERAVSVINTVLFLSVFCIAVFILLPALWVDPLYYITELFNEGVRVGIRKGHEQLVFGLLTNDGGFLFYPIVMLMKTSPYLLAVSLIGFIKLIKDKFRNETLVVFVVFYISYFCVMIIPDKKIDRYMVVMYPYLALFAAYGYQTIMQGGKRYVLGALHAVSVTAFIIYPLITLFPHYFTYTSPLFINSTIANSVIGQKPFGVGVYDLRDFIVQKYGIGAGLGFIDTKPMEAIYPNSLVADIRIEPEARYTIVVLGPNEEIPGELIAEGLTFTKDASIYINGLEYWRIYVKGYR